MLISELIENLFDFLDMIAENRCISDKLFTTLHPHLAAVIIIKLFNINVLTISVSILRILCRFSLLLFFLTVL